MVLDRHYREPVGPADQSHKRAERRAAALNAANARLKVVGHHLEREERDQLNAGLQAEAT